MSLFRQCDDWCPLVLSCQHPGLQPAPRTSLARTPCLSCSRGCPGRSPSRRRYPESWSPRWYHRCTSSSESCIASMPSLACPLWWSHGPSVLATSQSSPKPLNIPVFIFTHFDICYFCWAPEAWDCLFWRAVIILMTITVHFTCLWWLTIWE